jgi:hypothetical protein
MVCSVAHILFGVYFARDAARKLLKLAQLESERTAPR